MCSLLKSSISSTEDLCEITVNHTAFKSCRLDLGNKRVKKRLHRVFITRRSSHVCRLMHHSLEMSGGSNGRKNMLDANKPPMSLVINIKGSASSRAFPQSNDNFAILQYKKRESICFTTSPLITLSFQEDLKAALLQSDIITRSQHQIQNRVHLGTWHHKIRSTPSREG